MDTRHRPRAPRVDDEHSRVSPVTRISYSGQQFTTSPPPIARERPTTPADVLQGRIHANGRDLSVRVAPLSPEMSSRRETRPEEATTPECSFGGRDNLDARRGRLGDHPRTASGWARHPHGSPRPCPPASRFSTPPATLHDRVSDPRPRPDHFPSVLPGDPATPRLCTPSAHDFAPPRLRNPMTSRFNDSAPWDGAATATSDLEPGGMAFADRLQLSSVMQHR